MVTPGILLSDRRYHGACLRMRGWVRRAGIAPNWESGASCLIHRKTGRQMESVRQLIRFLTKGYQSQARRIARSRLHERVALGSTWMMYL